MWWCGGALDLFATRRHAESALSRVTSHGHLTVWNVISDFLHWRVFNQYDASGTAKTSITIYNRPTIQKHAKTGLVFIVRLVNTQSPVSSEANSLKLQRHWNAALGYLVTYHYLQMSCIEMCPTIATKQHFGRKTRTKFNLWTTLKQTFSTSWVWCHRSKVVPPVRCNEKMDLPSRFQTAVAKIHLVCFKRQFGHMAAGNLDSLCFFSFTF